MSQNEQKDTSTKQRRLSDHLKAIRPKGPLKWDDEQEKKLDWSDEPPRPDDHQPESLK